MMNDPSSGSIVASIFTCNSLHVSFLTAKKIYCFLIAAIIMVIRQSRTGYRKVTAWWMPGLVFGWGLNSEKMFKNKPRKAEVLGDR
jgi:hypothetical protein